MVALTPAPSQVGADETPSGRTGREGCLLMGVATCSNLARTRMEPQPDQGASLLSSRIGLPGDGCTVAGLHAPHHFVKGVSGVR